MAIYEGLNAGDKDFGPLIAKLKRANIDFVYFGYITPKWVCCCVKRAQASLEGQSWGLRQLAKSCLAIAGDASGLLVTLPSCLRE